MADAATEARELIRIVRDDAGLPPPVRQTAGALAELAAANPDLALERLDALQRDVAPVLPTEPPAVPYARCVSVEVFWRNNLSPEVKETFVTAEDYRRFIESDPAPQDRLVEHLGPQMLVPASNSWLVPSERLAGLSGAEMRVLLNFHQAPPYVVMLFSVQKMGAAGVAVRRPRGIDAIPSRQLQWFPDNVPDERIDGNIPVAALERLEWRT